MTAQLSDENRAEFEAEVGRLKAAKTSGVRDGRLLVLGVALAVVGILITLLCYVQATGFDDLRDQVQTMILALTGVALTLLGSALYVAGAVTRFLRLWLLRLIYEQRDR